MRQSERALKRNTKRRSKEQGFNEAQYKRGWYEVGRRLLKDKK